MLRDNRTFFASGMPKSGKSKLLGDILTGQFLSSVEAPRIISFDPTGDTWDRFPDAVAVRDVAQLRANLKKCVTDGYDGFHFVLNPKHAAAVFALLVPPDADPSPHGTPTLSRQLGGVVIECGECYTIAPNGGTPPEIVSAWTAGRHHLLSLAMAAQRPALTNRTLTGSTEHTFAFMHNNARDFDFFADTIGTTAAEEIRTLDRWEFVYYQSGATEAVRYDRHRRPVKRIPLRREIVALRD